MVALVTVIIAYLYWRCSCSHCSGCLICEVNFQINAVARQKLLIWANIQTTSLLNLC